MPIFGSWSSYPNTTLDGGELDVLDYTRLIELLESDGTTLIEKLSDFSDSSVGFLVTDASFELNRYGGCGSGSLEIVKSFNGARDIEVGQYIRMSYKDNEPWYYGRIEEVEYTSPATCTVRTYGLWSQLSDVIIGGNDGDYRPYLLARSDWFTNDPDYEFQTWVTASDYVDAVTAIYNDWIAPRFPLISLGPIEFPSQVDLFGYASMKFRGQETVGQVIRSLATMHKFSAFGIDEHNRFFCIAPRSRVLAEFTEGENCQTISLKKDRSLLFTRLLITGDYVYGMQIQPGYYRYRVCITNKGALATYGNKKASVHLPWVRTNDQAADFASSFFARYSQVSSRATLQTKAQSSLLKPWLGNIKLKDSAGATLLTDNLTSLQCSFNAVPVFDLVVGPEDLQWPEPPQPERWELAKDKGDLSSKPRNRGSSSSVSDSSDTFSSIGTWTPCGGVWQITIPEITVDYTFAPGASYNVYDGTELGDLLIARYTHPEVAGAFASVLSSNPAYIFFYGNVGTGIVDPNWGAGMLHGYEDIYTPQGPYKHLMLLHIPLTLNDIEYYDDETGAVVGCVGTPGTGGTKHIWYGSNDDYNCVTGVTFTKILWPEVWMLCAGIYKTLLQPGGGGTLPCSGGFESFYFPDTQVGALITVEDNSPATITLYQ